MQQAICNSNAKNGNRLRKRKLLSGKRYHFNMLTGQTCSGEQQGKNRARDFHAAIGREVGKNFPGQPVAAGMKGERVFQGNLLGVDGERGTTKTVSSTEIKRPFFQQLYKKRLRRNASVDSASLSELSNSLKQQYVAAKKQRVFRHAGLDPASSKPGELIPA
ncbi:MAG: hypothetical protein AB1461_16055 [Thermodesulfobacteriota bacterium]